MVWLSLMAVGWTLARPEVARYLHWPEVQPVLAAFTGAGEKPPEFTDDKDWDSWIRQKDAELRGRIDRGIEDSISSLVIFGASFTTLPRLASASEAVNAAGDLTPGARARVDAFLQALDRQDNERLRLTLEFLRRRRVTEDELKAFLSGNLRRFALDQAAPRGRRNTTASRTDGISSEASMLVNFAIEETLRSLKSKGAIPAHIRRIAVIGPGLEFAGLPEVYDLCPPQSVQPFAVLEGVLRLGLAQPSDVQVTAFDASPLVLSHLRASAARARAGRYTLQLPRPASSHWNAAASAYWQHLGETIGAPATSITAPPGVEVRAIAIKAQFAAHISVEELNIVTQTLEAAPGQSFDLVILTNVLSHYSPLEQALALAGIAQMLTGGGILLESGTPPAQKPKEFETLFESLGANVVSYSDGGTGDTVAMYRRR